MNDYFSLQYYPDNTTTEMTIQGTETGTLTTVTKDSSLNEYLNGTYLTTNLVLISNYIDEHMWDVGGPSIVTKDFKKEIDETKVNQWKGKIALFSAKDYKNASDNAIYCTSIYGNYYKSGTTYYPCSQNSNGNINNYLYKDYTQWSLSAFVDSSDRSYVVIAVGYLGNFDGIAASGERGVRPTFYLKSTIKLTGEGIEGNEFKIAES